MGRYIGKFGSWLITASLVMLAGYAVLMPQNATAANPTTMSFQGKVVNANGTNVVDGTYSFLLKLYTVASAGSPVWTETQATVGVAGGVFQVNLGVNCSFFVANACNNSTPIDFSTSNSLYLGITFNGDAAGEMTPRVQLQSVPFAFNADTANKVGGLTVSQLVQLTPGAQQTGSVNVSGASTFGGGVQLGKAGGSGINGNALFYNATNANTVSLLSGTTSLSYTLVLPNAIGATGDCVKLGTVAGASAPLTFGSCAVGGGSTMQGSYDVDADGSDVIIGLTSADGGMLIRDSASGIGATLFGVQSNGGTGKYLDVTSLAVTLQDAAGNNALVFDSATSHLKVYANVASPTAYVDIYYDNATSEAVFAASTGTTRVGNGSGNISMNLTGQNDVLTFAKTYVAAGAYASSDFSVTRSLTGGAFAITGNVMKIEDLTGGSASAPNVLYLNQNNATATGNLLLAQTGGVTDKFKVTTAGNATLAGGVTIGSGLSYTGTGAVIFTGAGAVSLLSGAATTLTVDSGTTGAMNVGASANAKTITTGNITGATGLVFNSGTAGAIFNTVASGQTLFTSGANIPSVDQVKIDNTSSTGVVTANANALQVSYKGGAANVEAAATRIDLTPGTTSGSIWSGMRVVAGATGPASGVTLYGMKLEGSTIAGAGQETGMYIGTGWDTGLDVQSGGLNLAGYTSGGLPADPAAPAADNLRVYAKKVAGRMTLKWKAPSGVDTSIQSSLAYNTINLWTPSLTSTGTGFGTVWPAGTGTFLNVVPTPGMANQLRRARFTNVVSTADQPLGVNASIAAQIPSFWRGNAAGQGGFFMQTRFTTELVPATTVRLFVGLTSQTTGAAIANTVTGDAAGLSHITTDNITTMAFLTRDNGTTNRATFTVPTIAAGNAYDFTMYCPPNGTTIYYRLVNLLDGTVIVDSSTTTNLPRNTIFMGPQVQMSNGANGTVTTTAIAINKIYIESDN